MSELENLTLEFDNMTPEELNIEFLDLLDQIPQEPEASGKDKYSDWHQRLQILLGHSQITNSFRTFITDDLSQQYLSGSRATEPWKQIYWPNLGEGGIFNKDQGEILDRDVYRYLFDDYRTNLERVHNGQSVSGLSDASIAVKQELLKSWRREFIDRYGDEP